MTENPSIFACSTYDLQFRGSSYSLKSAIDGRSVPIHILILEVHHVVKSIVWSLRRYVLSHLVGDEVLQANELLVDVLPAPRERTNQVQRQPSLLKHLVDLRVQNGERTAAERPQGVASTMCSTVATVDFDGPFVCRRDDSTARQSGLMLVQDIDDLSGLLVGRHCIVHLTIPVVVPSHVREDERELDIPQLMEHVFVDQAGVFGHVHNLSAAKLSGGGEEGVLAEWDTVVISAKLGPALILTVKPLDCFAVDLQT